VHGQACRAAVRAMVVVGALATGVMALVAALANV
jgi:hypothetical protein